ncbi:hypothetical protein [Niallia taxi]|uniref:hypothetical protein n=1 Tax=Niallia taxi TaxID=2499688 RepID=UPI0015F61536|nr:hypothetical protein [Niallia taxi]
MKHMNNKLIGNQRGGVSIMVLSLLALVFCVTVMVVSVDFALQSADIARLKNHVSLGLHAGSLEIDAQKLSEGNYEIKPSSKDKFYEYLRKNARLDNSNSATDESYLPTGSQVKIHELSYVDYEQGIIRPLENGRTNCALVDGKRVSCKITLHAGTDQETTREVNEVVIGPSLVAIIETQHHAIGNLNDEAIVIAGKQQVRFLGR